MEALEYVRAYIDDLMVITRGTLEDHLEKQREFLRRLRGAGLAINTAKPLFCTHKGTGDTRVKSPHNVKELWHSLSTVEECEMLAPLSY